MQCMRAHRCVHRMIVSCQTAGGLRLSARFVILHIKIMASQPDIMPNK